MIPDTGERVGLNSNQTTSLVRILRSVVSTKEFVASKVVSRAVVFCVAVLTFHPLVRIARLLHHSVILRVLAAYQIGTPAFTTCGTKTPIVLYCIFVYQE